MKSRCLAISLVIAALATIAPGASAQQPKPGGQIVHGSAQEPDRIWGPVTGLTVSSEISQLVNASLIEINDKLEYAPSLAIEVPTLDNGGISKDGLRYAFKLRPGVKWHDGAPFTSGDVAFTQTVLLNPDVDVRGRVGWNKIARVETPDDGTVIFHFSAIDAPFLDRVAALGILPRHILGKAQRRRDQGAQVVRAPVGTGPVRVQGVGARQPSRAREEPELLEAGQALPRPDHLQDRPRRQCAPEPARDGRHRHAPAPASTSTWTS